MSTQKQGLGVSLEAQKDAITAFASQHDLHVTRWFEEKETAAKSGRPVFNQMLKQLRQGKAAGLIMHKIDRSARNLRDWAAVSELPAAGIDIFFATESLDFRSRGGRLAANLQAVIAEDYIHNLREETIKGLTGRLKQGLYPFRAPIGYLDNGRGNPKTPCPKHAPLIRELFELYATGQYSIRSLMPVLQRLGLRNHAGQPLSQHGVETILNNPFYTGLIVIKRTGAVYCGQHEPIIGTATFRRVQAIKAGKAGKKSTRHNHLYRGLLHCGLCGGPMIPERQKGHVYYRCQLPTCPTTTMREDRASNAITDTLRQLQLGPADAAQLKEDWLAWIASDERDHVATSFDLQIAQLTERLNRLTDLLIDDTITKDIYHKRKQSLTLELAALTEQREKARTIHLSETAMEQFLELMKSLAELHISAKPLEKRWLVENCFSNRRVIGKELYLEPYSWLKSRDFSELSPLVTQNDSLLELSSKSDISQPADLKIPEVPQWKRNLKNQRPD